MSAPLPFPESLPGFQRLFPDDAACAAYLERVHWPNGFACPCGWAGEPYRFAARPHVLRCRQCKRDARLTAGTVMQDTRMPLSTWFWAAYLASTQIHGLSASNFQCQLDIGRYETAFQLLHKLRAGMVRPNQDRIGTGCNRDHVEVDEVWIGGRTRGEGRGVHSKVLVSGAVEVKTKAAPRRGGRYAGRLRLAVVPNRTAKALCGFVARAVEPGSMVVTDDWASYDRLAKDHGYLHLQVAERGDGNVAEEYLPIIHLIFSNLKTWLNGVHHGVSPQHLQGYLNEFTFRFNRRFYPFNAFRSLLGIAADVEAPTYESLYSGEYQHPWASTG